MNTPSGDRPLTRRVLVLDADLVPALSVARSLREIGLTVDVASHEARPITGHSRAVTEVLRYPNPLDDTRGFIAWIADVGARPDYDLIVPVTERTVSALLKHLDDYDGTRVAVAPGESLRIALEKNRTVALAESLGIPVPRSVLVRDVAELPEAVSRIGFPVVVKPVSSVGSDHSRAVQLAVSYAFDENELRATVDHALHFGEVILQEYFRGDGQGIELIADHGEVRYAFQHRRLHEVPLTGGGSSLRVSEEITPALLDAAARLMRAMHWHGVAMVEFKHDVASGQFRLMEINGRFWGSLPLAAAAGANFPAMLYELMVEGAVGQHRPARPGVYCRNLARDVQWHEQVLRRSAPARIVTLPTAGAVLRDALLIFHPRHAFDVQRLSDPRPGVVDLWRIVRTNWLRLASVLQRRRELEHQKRLARAGGPARRAMTQARSVLFLCYGNINRSALAHAYARCRYANRIEVASAGFHEREGRPADPLMVETASHRRVDLSDSRSVCVSRDMVERADVILAMELAHIEQLLARHPQARGKTFLLGSADSAGRHDVEIPDPYGKSPQVYAAVCERIIAAVDAWLKPCVRPE